MARSFDRLPLTDPRAFICECGHRGCTGRVYLTLDEYRALRSQPEHLVTARGHELGRRRVVAQTERFSIVERLGREPEPRELDPYSRVLLPTS